MINITQITIFTINLLGYKSIISVVVPDHKPLSKWCVIVLFLLCSMCGEKAMAPCHYPSTFAFHHCRLFLSHLGMFAWSKR